MGFFSALGGKIASGARWLGSKVQTSAHSIGGKLSHYGDLIGNIAEHAAPVLTVINPELGATAATVASVARGVGTAGRVLQAVGKEGAE